MKDKYDIDNYLPSIKKLKIIIQTKWEDNSIEEKDITDIYCKEVEWLIDDLLIEKINESDYYKKHPNYNEFNSLLNDDSDFAIQFNDSFKDFEEWLSNYKHKGLKIWEHLTIYIMAMKTY